jgi:hypothetical protein
MGRFRQNMTSTLMVKAISLWQPWASFIPLGLKHYETRSWKANYRGELLICSTAGNSKQYKEYLNICDELQLPPWSDFRHGQAIAQALTCQFAICDLVDCVEMTAEFIAEQSRTEILCGDWQVGRYAWKLENIQPIEKPFGVKGRQGFFRVSLGNLKSESSENNILTFGYGNQKTYHAVIAEGEADIQVGRIELYSPELSQLPTLP